jgi:putative transcriptional regulator
MNSSIEKPESGKILVSLPPLNDKFFGKSVVMLAEHGPDGSFGFIVNKPAKIKLNTLTFEFGDFEAEIYLGGPVRVDNIFYVHSKGKEISGSLKIVDGVYWGGKVEDIKNLILSGALTNNDIRFYAGYSGWQPRQLDQEMEENSWIVLNGQKSHVFESRPASLWKKIMLSQGEDFAPWVHFPSDPNMN